MPQVRFAPAALRDLEKLREFLRPKNPAAARRAALTIIKAVQVLGQHPQIGRPAEEMEPMYRELLIDFGDSGKDLALPEGVEVLDSVDAAVIRIVIAKVEVVAEPVPGVVVEGAVAAEPESASTKGKKDEEGKVIEKASPTRKNSNGPKHAGENSVPHSQR